MDFLNTITLSPLEVAIDGIASPVAIHRFSWGDWDEHIAPKIQDEDLAIAVLYLLNPLGYQHQEADKEKLREKLGVPQILQIYREGLRLNGCSIGSSQDAKKD